MATPEAVRRRYRERHIAAAVRAVSGEPSADLRARRLRIGGSFVGSASPHLAADLAEVELPVARGVGDGFGLLVRNSDRTLHRQLAPKDPLERVVFDLCEQLRCEALAPVELRGLRRNLDAGFDDWILRMQRDGVTETGVGMLIFTITLMVRSRHGHMINDQLLDETIESTRGNLAPLVGAALAELAAVVDDQRAYAFHAREIAEAVALVAGDAALAPESRSVIERSKVLLADWDDADESTDDVADSGDGAGVESVVADLDLEGLGGYLVFSREFDRVVAGDELVHHTRRIELRESLDDFRRAQAVSAPRIAQRLKRQLALPAIDGWSFAQEDGQLDAARLSQLVTDPTNHRVFRHEAVQPSAELCVTFLVDTSGSMKAQRYETLAVMLDTFTQALDLAGAACEVLGFTTGAWNGGRAMKAWRAAGAPADPGRLNEIQHIVYSDADTSWRRSRRSLAAMLSTYHYRESVDGEALIWAYERLRSRPEARRLLVVVSDGAPMDAATSNHNRLGFLDDHLRAVARGIERRGEVELGAISLDRDVAGVFSRSVALDLAAPLTVSTYDLLPELF